MDFFYRLKKTVSVILVSITCLMLASCFSKPQYLEQNWTSENQLREKFYHSSQGSQLIPYQWFLHLTDAQFNRPINSPFIMETLRFLPDYSPDPANNPDGLAIGFVKDIDAETGEWIGVNCAACHTGQIDFKGVSLRIDGAPAMADYIGMLKMVRDALASTLVNNTKFNQFFAALLQNDTSLQAEQLRIDMAESVAEITGFILRDHSPQHVPGFGRVDAFSAIRNEIFVHDLGVKENFQLPTAPVSFPFLWDTPQLERVEWSGHVENPFGRNIGQVFGVLGRLNLQGTSKMFESTVRRDNVYWLETWVDQLQAPQWPEKLLGKINTEAAARGKQLYITADSSGYSCADCHSVKNADGRYPLTDAANNRFGQQFIKTHNIAVDTIGTDPNSAHNIFDSLPLKTGSLASYLGGQTEMVGLDMLRAVTAYSIDALFEQAPALSTQQQNTYNGFRENAEGFRPEPLIKGYKARPLAGVWATAPYLHNGSVPNLYELLSPVSERSEQFWVGNRTFDNIKVGFVSTEKGDNFLLDTRVSGNRNTGHEYGTKLSEQERWDLVEFIKTL